MGQTSVHSLPVPSAFSSPGLDCRCSRGPFVASDPAPHEQQSPCQEPLGTRHRVQECHSRRQADGDRRAALFAETAVERTGRAAIRTTDRPLDRARGHFPSTEVTHRRRRCFRAHRRDPPVVCRRRASKRRTGRQPPGGRGHAAANRESATVARRPVNQAAVNGTSA